MRRPMHASSPRRAAASATVSAYLTQRRWHGLWRGPERRLRARPPFPASHARLHVRGAAKASPSTTPRRRSSASRKAAARRMRLDVVRVPAEQQLSEYLTSGWIEGIEAKLGRELGINGFTAATAIAKGDQWSFRLYAVRFGSDVYRFIYAIQAHDAGHRPDLPRFGRELPPHEPRGDKLGQAVADAGSSPWPRTTRSRRSAARMAIHDRAAERFRMLNGLAATGNASSRATRSRS